MEAAEAEQGRCQQRPDYQCCRSTSSTALTVVVPDATSIGGSHIHPVITLEIRFVNGTSWHHVFWRSCTVDYVKNVLEGKLGICKCDQQLVVETKVLHNSEMLAEIFPAEESSSITCVIHKQHVSKWTRYSSDAHDGCPVYYNDETGELKWELAQDDVSDERTACHHAMACGDIQMMNAFLSGVAMSDNAKRVLLAPFAAALYGHVDMVKLLLASQGGLESIDECGLTPLQSACLGGHSAVVHHLEAHADVETRCHEGNGTPLHQAAFHGHAEVANQLLTQGVCLRARHDVERRSHGAILESLLEAKMSVGATPLISAATAGHLALVRCLLLHGACHEAVTNFGHTAEACAAFRGYRDVASALRRHRRFFDPPVCGSP